MSFKNSGLVLKGGQTVCQSAQPAARRLHSACQVDRSRNPIPIPQHMLCQDKSLNGAKNGKQGTKTSLPQKTPEEAKEDKRGGSQKGPRSNGEC